MASGPMTSRQIDGETVETMTDLIFMACQVTGDLTAAMNLKEACSLEEKL